MTAAPLDAMDPSAARPGQRRPGRPSRTSLAELVDAGVAIGLDRFTLAEVAARVGVGESTVYNYVSGRDELYRLAAAAVFEQLDLDVDVPTWTDYVDEVSRRAAELVGRHPGLREYVLAGPYEVSTRAIFEAIVDRVHAWLPTIPDHTAFVIASRPVVATLVYLGDPVLEPVVDWMRRAQLAGLDDAVRRGDLPAVPDVSWREKLAGH